MWRGTSYFEKVYWIENRPEVTFGADLGCKYRFSALGVYLGLFYNYIRLSTKTNLTADDWHTVKDVEGVHLNNNVIGVKLGFGFLNNVVASYLNNCPIKLIGQLFFHTYSHRSIPKIPQINSI